MNINGENASLFSSNFCHESYSCKLLESQSEELLYSLSVMPLATVFPYYQYIIFLFHSYFF